MNENSDAAYAKRRSLLAVRKIVFAGDGTVVSTVVPKGSSQPTGVGSAQAELKGQESSGGNPSQHKISPQKAADGPAPPASQPAPPATQTASQTDAATEVACAAAPATTEPSQDRAQQPQEMHVASPTPGAAAAAAGSLDPPQSNDDGANPPAEAPEERNEPPSPVVPKVDLAEEARRARTAIPPGCPTAVAVSWMLQETLRRGVAPGDDAAAAAAEKFLRAFKGRLDQQVAAAQRLLQGGPGELEQFDRLPPMIREMCSEERVKANLRLQLAALEEEERAWQALEEKYQPGVAGVVGFGEAEGGARPLGSPGHEMDEAVGKAALPSVNVDALQAARKLTDKQLNFQMNGLEAFLDKAEQLFVRAQSICSALQAGYHKENFANHPHVNSPQVLVKMLSSAVPAKGIDFVPQTQLPSQG